MRQAWLRLPVAALVLLLIGVAPLAAKDYDTIVTGRGDPSQDVANVQAALDLGGDVLLRGIFDFGTDGFVNVTTDVFLVGERRGPQMATIRGGLLSLRSETAATLGVRRLRFEGSLYAAIYVNRSTGLEIRDSVFLEMLPGIWGGYVMPVASAIAVTTWTDLGPGDPRGVITGEFIIEDNFVRLIEDPTVSRHGHAISIDFADVDLRIRNNRIHDTGCNAIEVWNNVGPTVISGNEIVPGPLVDPDDPQAGNGMMVGEYSELFGLPFHRGSMLITDNEVFCTNPNADGIVLQDMVSGPQDGADTVVTKNHVTMQESLYGALTLYAGGYNTVWSQNKIEGSMEWAIGVLPWFGFPMAAEHNIFMANNTSLAETGLCDVLFDTGANYNLVVGRCDTAVDSGLENVIKSHGGGPQFHRMGQEVRDAVALKRELMQAARD